MGGSYHGRVTEGLGAHFVGTVTADHDHSQRGDTMNDFVRRRPARRAAAALSTVALLVALVSCSSGTDAVNDAGQAGNDVVAGSSSDDDGSAEGSAATAPDSAAGADVKGADLSAVEGTIYWPELVADVPTVDGQVSAGTHGNSSVDQTKTQRMMVDTDIQVPETGDEARTLLADAGWTEQSYGVGTGPTGESVRSIFTKDDRALKLEIDDRVRYTVRQIPSGSFGEKDFICGQIHSATAVVGLLPMSIQLQTGEPLTADEIDYTFAGVDGMIDRMPEALAAAMTDLRDALATAVGEPEAGPGTEIGDAIAAASADAGPAIDAYCS